MVVSVNDSTNFNSEVIKKKNIELGNVYGRTLHVKLECSVAKKVGAIFAAIFTLGFALISQNIREAIKGNKIMSIAIPNSMNAIKQLLIPSKDRSIEESNIAIAKFKKFAIPLLYEKSRGERLKDQDGKSYTLKTLENKFDNSINEEKFRKRTLDQIFEIIQNKLNIVMLSGNDALEAARAELQSMPNFNPDVDDDTVLMTISNMFLKHLQNDPDLDVKYYGVTDLRKLNEADRNEFLALMDKLIQGDDPENDSKH